MAPLKKREGLGGHTERERSITFWSAPNARTEKGEEVRDVSRILIKKDMLRLETQNRKRPSPPMKVENCE